MFLQFKSREETEKYNEKVRQEKEKQLEEIIKQNQVLSEAIARYNEKIEKDKQAELDDREREHQKISKEIAGHNQKALELKDQRREGVDDITLKSRLETEKYNEKVHQEKEKQLQELKESNECKELKELSEQKKKISSSINLLESEFLTLFSALEHPLKKYSKVSLDYRQLTEKYLENPISTLLVDRDKKIIEILQSLRKAIETHAIEIKEKKREKALGIFAERR